MHDFIVVCFVFRLNAMQVGRHSPQVSGLGYGLLSSSQVAICDSILDKLGFWFGLIWLWHCAKFKHI